MRIPKDLVAASATPLVLALLADGESYGYEILQRVRELSDGRLTWTDGMLYPLLHRLEAMDLIEGVWRTPDAGRRRRYYRLTTQGEDALVRHRHHWDAVAATLAKAWDGMERSLASPSKTHPAVAG